MKKCNLTEEQLSQHVHKLNDLEVRESAIQREALQGIKDILLHCEDNKHYFPISGNEDEDVIVSIPDDDGNMEKMTVESIELVKDDVRITTTNGGNYQLWETDKPNTYFYCDLISDVEFDMIAES